MRKCKPKIIRKCKPKIIRKCKSEFCSKIHEALLIKKLSPKLNPQMFANGASYLLYIF